jgi:hypothetical protein
MKEKSEKLKYLEKLKLDLIEEYPHLAEFQARIDLAMKDKTPEERLDILSKYANIKIKELQDVLKSLEDKLK